MRIPPYWTKATYRDRDPQGKERAFTAYGWSFQGRAAAQEDAAARAKRIFDRVVLDGTRPDSYDYLDRPLREEIVQSLDRGDTHVAVITRNRYGCLVLNATRTCFVDVDYPPVRSEGLIDGLALFFSNRRRQARAEALRQTTLERIRSWADLHRQRSFRLYRTAAGLRLLFTDRVYDPTSQEVIGLLQDLGSDPLYQRLTLKQECFRARLTPKPWRCGCKRPPSLYPWDTPDQERDYRRWQGEYEGKARAYVTCEYLQSFGRSVSDEQIDLVLATHDQYACGHAQSRLA
jgi:hypothetical protein